MHQIGLTVRTPTRSDRLGSISVYVQTLIGIPSCPWEKSRLRPFAETFPPRSRTGAVGRPQHWYTRISFAGVRSLIYY